MNKRIIISCLSLLLLVATTIQGNQTFTVDDGTYSAWTTSSADKAHIKGPYYNLIIKEGDCSNKDVYMWCVDSIDWDEVEYFDVDTRINNYYEIQLTVTRTCDSSECVAYGEACAENITCNGACVHDICRPLEPWCGDTFCDDKEDYDSCPDDCPFVDPVINNTNTTSQPENTTNMTSNNMTSTVNDSINDSSDVNVTTNSTIINDANATSVTVNKTNTTIADRIKNKIPPQKDDGPNVVGAVITVIIGLLLIVFLIIKGRRGRRREALMNLDSQ